MNCGWGRPARRIGGLLAGFAALAATLPLAACGVPSSGRPVVVGDARPGGAPSNANPTQKDSPAGVTDPQELVRRYLKAAAWGNEVGQDNPGALDKAAEFARRFMTAAGQAKWQRGQDITVVHTHINIPTPIPNGIRVDVELQPVGVLTERGSIEPRPTIPAQTYQFTVVPADEGGGLRIDNPPNGMLLSDEGLDSLYNVQPIYFWDLANRELVPDLRYINKSLSDANKVVELTTWLGDGPSQYLKVNTAVNPVPAAIEIKDRPVLDGSGPGPRVRVNLSAKAASVQDKLPKFVEQLRWSLRGLTGPVELQIEGQRQNLPAADQGLDNPAALDGQKDPPRFCVADGHVRQLAGDPISFPVLSSDTNAGVVSAAILRTNDPQVAVVRNEGAGRLGLWLGSVDKLSGAAKYNRADLTATSMSRPVGVLTPAPVFLVAADGALFSVSTRDRSATDVTPPGVGLLTAVSVAPDGRRVAIVAGGRVYTSVLAFDDGGSVSVATPMQEVRPGLSDAVGVAWSREEWLVVAGHSAGQSALVEATVDGALVEPLTLRNLPGLNVTRVVAAPVVRPDSPTRGERGLILIEANNRTYTVYSGSVEETDLATSSPSPSPSASAGKDSSPTAPFFLD